MTFQKYNFRGLIPGEKLLLFINHESLSLEYFLHFNNPSTSIIAPVLHFTISVAVQVDSGCIPNTQAPLAAWTPHRSHFLCIST